MWSDFRFYITVVVRNVFQPVCRKEFLQLECVVTLPEKNNNTKRISAVGLWMKTSVREYVFDVFSDSKNAFLRLFERTCQKVVSKSSVLNSSKWVHNSRPLNVDFFRQSKNGTTFVWVAARVCSNTGENYSELWKLQKMSALNQGLSVQAYTVFLRDCSVATLTMFWTVILKK